MINLLILNLILLLLVKQVNIFIYNSVLSVVVDIVLKHMITRLLQALMGNYFLVTIDGVKNSHIDDIVRIILEARENEKTTISCKISIMNNLSLHPQLGVPIMYHDQLNLVATHLFDVKEEDNMSTLAHQTYLNNCLPSIKTLHSKKARKLIRRILKSQTDWNA